MNVVHGTGIAGAQQARGVVIVIDVLRSFTVSAFALAGGARECLLVPTVDQARALARQVPGAVICAEEEALPVQGIAISNSPTQVAATDLKGKTLIQRSSAGTPVMDAVRESEAMFAGSLVVARATAQACLLRKPSTVTLVASADFPEDHACARYLEALLTGRSAGDGRARAGRMRDDLDSWLEPLRSSDRYRRVSAGLWPGFPATDLELSLEPDHFDFAMPVTRQGGYLRVTRESNQDGKLA